MCSSCGSQRKANRGIKKLEKLQERYSDVWGEISRETVRIDTVIQQIEVPGEVQIVVDSFRVDSLAYALDSIMNQKSIPDTVKGDVIRETITRYVPRLVTVDSVLVDTLDIEFRLWVDDSKIKYHIQRDSISIVKEQEVDKINPIEYITVYKIPWWMWLILIALAAGFVRFLFKK